MNSPCIYAIWFPTAADKCVYVGQTRRSLSIRASDHRGNLRRGCKWSFKLYNWMRERIAQGHEPQFLLLEACDSDALARLESQWQAWFRDAGWTAKHLKGGEANAGGYKLTEEHKAKLSAAKLGTKRGPMSEETKKKIGAANRGIKRTPEQIDKNRQASTGRKQSPETIAKRIATMSAKSPEELAEIQAKKAVSLTGQKRSEETKLRMRLAQLGKKASPETRAKMSAQRKGVKRGSRNN